MPSKKLTTDPYKGVRDFYPEDMALQQYIFDIWAATAESFGYVRYDASILEPAELYHAKTGEEIINEQTYTFTDRGDREVTLRPEMTPTVARMVAGKRRELPFPLRWYSIPNLFRYERPQKGRLREHWQLNCDIFGADTVAADVEIIQLAHEIMRNFGADDDTFQIHINDRGWIDTQIAVHNLSPEDATRLIKLIDKKDKIDDFEEQARAILGDAPDFLNAEPEKDSRLAQTRETLAELGITNVKINPTVVRGFDYYDGIVFEIFDTSGENTRSLFGGGRYNNLAGLFGGDSIPAIGFGMGDVTIRDFLTTHALIPDELMLGVEIMLLVLDESLQTKALGIAQEIRESGLGVAVELSGKKLGDQIKLAEKRGARNIIVIGENEIRDNTYTLKRLADGEETVGSIPKLLSELYS